MANEKRNKALQKYFVVMENDDHNKFDDVVLLLHKHARTSLVQGLFIASAVHTQGEYPVGMWHEEVASTIFARLKEAGLSVKLEDADEWKNPE